MAGPAQSDVDVVTHVIMCEMRTTCFDHVYHVTQSSTANTDVVHSFLCAYAVYGTRIASGRHTSAVRVLPPGEHASPSQFTLDYCFDAREDVRDHLD